MDYIQSTHVLTAGYLQFVKECCREIDTPYAKSALRELNRNVPRLEKFDLNIRDYEDPVLLIKDRQLQGLITKYPSLPIADDPADACLSTYYKFEESCWRTNESISSGHLFDDPDVQSVLFYAKRKNEKILGRTPLPQELGFAFGPGANYSVKRRTSVVDKLTSTPDCTLNAARDFIEALSSAPRLWTLWGGTGRSFPKLNIVRGSRFGQVPKNAKTNRPIDIEPVGNSILQKGYGTVIRNRLARAGNCIRSGQARHAILAREASVTKTLATVDKKGASDSISSLLVAELLPPTWFDALDRARSPYHLINGNWEELNKFSAMGNDYTFELETLLFLTLARATCQHLGITGDISVYGDDVILPSAAYELYVRVCNAVGFQINEDKTYYGDDHFRESCGADWFNGIDVRVAYMRHDASPHYLTALHNRLVELGTSELLPRSIKILQQLVPARFRRFGPPSTHRYGYLHSWDHLDPVQAISVTPRKYRIPRGCGLVYALYSAQQLGKYQWNENLEWFFKRGITMERFTRRKDFKLGSITIQSDGLIGSTNEYYRTIGRGLNHVEKFTWGQFKE
jgi:hypothetical protein